MSEVREGYKMTELGEIPRDWEVSTISDITNLIKDGTHNPPPRTVEGVPLLSAENIKNGKIHFGLNEKNISKEDFDKMHQFYQIEKNDVLMTIVGTIGRTAVVPEDIKEFTVQRSVAIFKIAENYSPIFFNYVLNTAYIKKQLERRASTTAQAGIYLGELAKINIIIPSYEEQKKIASILSTVDEQIDETEQLIIKTKELKKGLMQQLLTKGIGHKEFKQTNLGEIPISWDIVLFKNLCERIIVGIASSTTEYYTSPENGVSIIRNQNIKENNLDSSDILYITKEFDEMNNKKRLKQGDLLTVRTGYPGITCVVTKQFENAQSFTTLISTPKKEVSDSNYLAYYMNSPLGKAQLKNLSAGGAQQNLNVASLSNYEVILPSLEEQQKIASILSTVDEQIDIYEQEKAKYEELKKGLMQKLLTGQIRVKI